MTLLNVAVTNFKIESSSLVSVVIPELFFKAQKAGLPLLHTSDIDKSLFKTQLMVLRLLTTSFEELCLQPIYTEQNLSILGPLVTFLIEFFNNDIDQANKKVVLRILKVIWMQTNNVNPEIIDLMLTKKQKASWVKLPFTSINNLNNQLIEVVVRNAI